MARVCVGRGGRNSCHKQSIMEIGRAARARCGATRSGPSRPLVDVVEKLQQRDRKSGGCWYHSVDEAIVRERMRKAQDVLEMKEVYALSTPSRGVRIS